MFTRIRDLFTRWTDRLFLSMAARRGVIPMRAGAVRDAEQALSRNLTFVCTTSGSLHDGTTPSALKRHAVRKITHLNSVALQALSFGRFVARNRRAS